MKTIYSLLIFTTLAFTAIGCGGSNSPSDLATTSRVTKQEVIQAVQQGFSSKQQGQTLSSRQASRAERPSFYNDYYQVWSVSVEGGEDYFVDEALTIPAGKLRSSFSMGEDGSATKGQSFEITAGPRKGFTETVSAIANESGTRYEVEGVNPLDGPYTVVGTYVTATGVLTTKSGFRDAQGNVRFYDVESPGDGSYKVRYNSDKLFTFELSYTAEGAGTGRVSGSSELLPATINWDRLGAGTLTFKDGSTQTFTDFRFEF